MLAYQSCKSVPFALSDMYISDRHIYEYVPLRYIYVKYISKYISDEHIYIVCVRTRRICQYMPHSILYVPVIYVCLLHVYTAQTYVQARASYIDTSYIYISDRHIYIVCVRTHRIC